jgi:hypothetical protein
MLPTCPQCGRDFVKRTHREGLIEHVLSAVYVYPYRCQLCTHRFRAMEWGKRYTKQAIDKRQYDRFTVSVPALLLSDLGRGEGTVVDLSMGGCGMETGVPLQTGALVQLELSQEAGEKPILVESAVVRSVRNKFVGLQFLRLQPEDELRLSQFVHSLWATSRR